MEEGKSEDKSEVRNEKEKSPINKLQENLYSRDKPPILDKERHGFSPKSVDGVKEAWFPAKTAPRSKKRRELFHKIFFSFTWLKKALILATVFFALAVAVSIFVIFGGLNLVSTQNVEIAVSGLTVIEGGEELALDVTLKNGNRVGLENVVLTVEYPEGVRDYLDVNNPLIRQEERIEKVPARDEATRTFRAVLFGEQNSIKSIRVIAEYNTEDSGAVFTREKLYEVVVRSSPVTISLSAPKETNAGQEISLNLDISSNSTSVVEELMVSLDFPIGFTLLSASPSPDFKNRLWKIQNLEPREKREIVIKGRLDGAVNEEKPFRAAVGSPQRDDSEDIGVEFFSVVKSIVIKESFINLSVNVNGSQSGDYVVKIGSRMRVRINWQNNLPVDLNDVSLEAKLGGPAYDRASVSVDEKRGFYRSVDDTVIWNKDTFGVFSRVTAGQSGDLSFNFNLRSKEWATTSRLREGYATLTVTMKGTRFLESSPPEEVFSTVSRLVKIETTFSLDGETVYSTGPFVNSGPIPPKAEQPTTYTIIWNVKNTFNSVDNALVTATLPIYVDWLGKISPSGEEIMYNPLTRTVAWNVGNVNAWTGFLSSPRQAAFQISFLPSLSHLGESPVLVNAPSIVSTDKFTFTDIFQTIKSLTTKISNTDPISSGQSGEVVR